MALVDDGEGFVEVVGFVEAEDGAEDLGAGDVAIEREAFEDGGLEEVAVVEAGDAGVAAVDGDARAFLLGGGDEAADAGLAFGGDDGAHLDGVEAEAGDTGGGGIAEGVAEGGAGVADEDGHGGGEAALAGAAEGRIGDHLDGGFEVGVGGDDDGIFGAALALDALAVFGGAGVDVAGGGGGADEADGLDAGVIEEGVDGFAGAVDEVDHAGREAEFLEDAEDVGHGERDALGGFEDDGVAGDEGVGQEPEGDHAGEVEGRDDGADAEGLADGELVDALGDVLGEEALGEDGGGAGDLDIFDGAAHFASRFGYCLAAFEGDGFGQFFEVLFEAGFEAEEVLDAIGERGAAPGGEGAVGGVDGGVGLGGRR